MVVNVLDFHMVECGLSLGPSGLKLMLRKCACVPKILRKELRRDRGMAILLGRGAKYFSRSLS